MSSSVQSAVLTLLHTALGAGILAMPYAFKPFGLLLGYFIIVFCGCCSMTGLVLQSYVAKYVPSRHASFFSLAQLSYPQLSVLFDCAIAVKCFGVGISYMVVVGDLMPQVVSNFTSNALLLERNLHITICMLFVVSPLCFMKRLDSLKYASMIAIAAVAYLCLLVLLHYVFPSSEIDPLRGQVSFGIPHTSSTASMLSNFPIFVFAYTCHHNMFSIVNELRDNSVKNCMRVIFISIPLAVALYITIGGSGYLTFGDKILGNIVTLYPQSISSTIGRVAIILLVMLAFPLQCHPARASINHVWHYFTSPTAVLPSNENSGLISNEAACTSAFSDADYNVPEEWVERPPSSSSAQPKGIVLEGKRFVLITSAILLFSYLIAISVTSLARVLAVVGATGSTSISFILPGIFGYQIIGSEFTKTNIPTYLKLLKYVSLALTIWGVVVMLTCLTAALALGAQH